MKGFVLATVPQRIWELPSDVQQRHRGSDYNVAAWVKVDGYHGDLLLVVQHVDEAGTHRAVVDRACLKQGETSLLMSGLVNLRFTGDVAGVKVVLAGDRDDMSYRVDELFMQRTDDKAGPENKLISNYG